MSRRASRSRRGALAAAHKREQHCLLRQDSPKGIDLQHYIQQQVDAVARELNRRPRQTLGWRNCPHSPPRLLRRPVETAGSTPVPERGGLDTLITFSDYSARSATMGSMVAPRHAGPALDSNEITARVAAATT